MSSIVYLEGSATEVWKCRNSLNLSDRWPCDPSAHMIYCQKSKKTSKISNFMIVTLYELL